MSQLRQAQAGPVLLLTAWGAGPLGRGLSHVFGLAGALKPALTAARG